MTDVATLIEQLNDEYWRTRYYAAEALGDMSEEAKDAIPALAERLSDVDGVVPVNAAIALGKIGDPAVVPILARALSGQSEKVRMYAAEGLGKIGEAAKDAVPELIKALSDVDWGVRDCAARALGRIGEAAKDAVPELIKTLKKPSSVEEEEYVHNSAAYALGRIGEAAKDALPALIEALSDEAVCEYAAWALRQIGTPAAVNALGGKDLR